MKILNSAILSLALLIGFALSQNLYAAEPSQVAADHLKMAKYYEGKASEQDAIIAEQQQMKSDYEKRFYIDEKGENLTTSRPLREVKEMEGHCDAIINDARKLKDDYLEFAKWHRMRAAELQGK